MTETNESEKRQERRRYIRVNIYAITRYYCLLRNAEVGVQTRISDISEGGAMLITFEEGIPIDTEVSVSFTLPMPDKEEFLNVKGIVKHTGPLEQDLYRSGIEFTKLSSSQVKSIRAYVESKKK